MTLQQQIAFTQELIDEVTRADMRLKGTPGYDGSYLETAEGLEEVLESLYRLEGLEK